MNVAELRSRVGHMRDRGVERLDVRARHAGRRIRLDPAQRGCTGGGAAAVATGMTALCMGNDIGGSIRIPSHFCGIYGIKPTENLVSKHGISPGMPRMDSVGYRSVRHLACSGPLARSIEDLILSLRIIAGPDLKDQDVPVVCLDDPPPREMKDLRIAWTDDFGGITVTEETSRAIQEFAGRLARAGCTVERAQPENFDPEMVWGTYGRIMDMELGPYNPPLMRFVNFLFGWAYRKDVPMIRMVYPITFDKYMTDLTRRDALTASLEEFLQEWDVWVTPVSTTPAYPHIEPKTYFGPYPVYTQGVSVDGTEINYLVANSAYTTVFNLTGSPVVVTPIAYTEDGMPIGGRERLEGQFTGLSGSPRDQQGDDLMDVARGGTLVPDQGETLVSLYQQRRVTALMPLMLKIQPMRDNEKKILEYVERDLIVKRNHRMAERALPLLQKGNLFIAVGALHLSGKEGLVELLRAAGYKVTAIH